MRNVAQAILAGGGIHKGSLLRWNNFVSWSRICDSLMYTGLSVVLLEWLIRCLLLEDLMGMTVDNHPLLVFSIIAGANSVYISAHNIYRGFPKAAIIGNLFRSALAIPMSILFNDILAFFRRFLRHASRRDSGARSCHRVQVCFGYCGGDHRVSG